MPQHEQNNIRISAARHVLVMQQQQQSTSRSNTKASALSVSAFCITRCFFPGEKSTLRSNLDAISALYFGQSNCPTTLRFAFVRN
jgi:hypothetical protein